MNLGRHRDLRAGQEVLVSDEVPLWIDIAFGLKLCKRGASFAYYNLGLVNDPALFAVVQRPRTGSALLTSSGRELSGS